MTVHRQTGGWSLTAVDGVVKRGRAVARGGERLLAPTTRIPRTAPGVVVIGTRSGFHLLLQDHPPNATPDLKEVTERRRHGTVASERKEGRCGFSFSVKKKKKKPSPSVDCDSRSPRLLLLRTVSLGPSTLKEKTDIHESVLFGSGVH